MAGAITVYRDEQHGYESFSPCETQKKLLCIGCN